MIERGMSVLALLALSVPVIFPLTHEDSNPATGEVEDKHFWLVEHDGLVFGSGWHHDESGS